MSAATASAHAHAHPCAAPCVLYVSECVLPTFGLSLTRQDICGLLEALSYGMTSAATYRVGGEAAECLQEAVVEMMAWGARRIFPSVISVQDAKIVARADLRCDVIGAPGEKALCVRSSDPFLAEDACEAMLEFTGIRRTPCGVLRRFALGLPQGFNFGAARISWRDGG